jgi:hypothetical protein
MFSRFSVGLADSNTEILQYLEERLHVMYTPNPVVTFVKSTVDYKKWIKPHLMNLKGQSAPHSFRLHTTLPDRVQFKIWTRHKKWLPEGGLLFLKSAQLLHDTQTPAGLSDRQELDTEEIIQDIRKEFASQFLREESMQEWEAYFESWRSYVEPEHSEVWLAFMERFNNADGDNSMVVEEKAEQKDGRTSEDDVEDNVLYTTSKRKTKASDMDMNIVCGTMAAIWVEGSRLPFECGRIKGYDDEETITIQWYNTRARNGRGMWWPLQQSGTTRSYEQDIHLESVIWAGFELLNSNKIPAREVVIINKRMARILEDRE